MLGNCTKLSSSVIKNCSKGLPLKILRGLRQFLLSRNQIIRLSHYLHDFIAISPKLRKQIVVIFLQLKDHCEMVG